MKNEKLTTDEYDALEQIRRGASHDRVNACVGRNAKRLSGIKLIKYERNGGKVELTDKGQEVLFLRRCVTTLRALAADPAADVDSRRPAVPRQEVAHRAAGRRRLRADRQGPRIAGRHRVAGRSPRTVSPE